MKCFDKYCLTKLENYVTQVQWKTREDKEFDDTSALQNITSKSKLLELIANEVYDDKVDLVDIDQNYVSIKSKEILKDANADEIENLKIIASKFDNKDFNKEAKQTLKNFEQFQIEKEELEEKLRAEEEARKKLEEELEAERRENLFNKKLAGTDIKEVVSLQHHIDRATDKINRNIDHLIEGINNESPGTALLKFVEKISLESKKISSVVQFVTNANFNLRATSIKKDLSRFVKDYIENVHQEYEHLKVNKQLLKVDIKTDEKPFIVSFRPIEVIMIIDNLFSNSYRAKARHVDITLKNKADSALEFSFEDDGKGITDTNLPRIFNLGFTTTEGSGIGLYHVKQLTERMNGEVIVNNKRDKGVLFKIILRKDEA